MNRYVIKYYNHWGCCDQEFYVEAKDEEDAERIFSILEPMHYKTRGIDSIDDYDPEPEFYTQEDVAKKALRDAK